jgi:alpha-ketoglutarate-dependent taurine dioxygenase
LNTSFITKIELSDAERSAFKTGIKNKNLDALKDKFQQLEKDLATNVRGFILHLESEHESYFNYQELAEIPALMGTYFGNLLVQNEKGDKVIMVYDRDRLGSMFQGARYHQTREGGSIHTDNVNIPEPWEYLFLSCLEPAEVGGENILVDGVKIHEILKNKYPRALKVLEENFYWEMRGVSDALYQAPIITYDKKGEPLFRHLRPYMESAHVKASVPLTNDQLYALDVLDALTNSSEYQTRYRMRKGDILITRDAQVLHGRTCFSDAMEAVTFDDYHQGKGNILKRTMERIWIKK